ncbi:MAG: type III pantothenate kinase [Wenzhouxiangella sp.]
MNEWVIDAGHTRVKWARLDADGRIAAASGCPIADIDRLDDDLACSPGGRILASLQTREPLAERIGEMARRHDCRLHALATASVALEVAPAYPGLGSDRWLALQHPWATTGGAVCVIDCGTAMTIDVVDDSGRHLGGWIMAGLETARESLLGRAERLPCERARAVRPDVPATDTATGVEAGIRLQMAGAVERGVAAATGRLGKNPVVWLTGGDAAAIMPLVRIDAQMDEHLVLRGLAMAARKC